MGMVASTGCGSRWNGHWREGERKPKDTARRSAGTSALHRSRGSRAAFGDIRSGLPGKRVPLVRHETDVIAVDAAFHEVAHRSPCLI